MKMSTYVSRSIVKDSGVDRKLRLPLAAFHLALITRRDKPDSQTIR